MALLEVRDLKVSFGEVEVLRGVSFDLVEGETLGVVGESGCGKSMTAFSIMRMLPGSGRIVEGSIRLDGRELTTLREREMRQVRGGEIALVMQDPFTSLNPMMRIGDQVAEAILFHREITKAKAKDLAVEMLEDVGIPAPDSAAKKYPHQLSGGQRQRVVIAMAFACRPKVLLADEPTTALDVTLQAQILRLLNELQKKEGTAVMLISHDIGVIGSVSHKIAVFYAGRIIETGSADEVLLNPGAPYTQALLGAMPTAGKKTLESIPGQPPLLGKLPKGCSFGPRCSHRTERCDVEPQLLNLSGDRQAACWWTEDQWKGLKNRA